MIGEISFGGVYVPALLFLAVATTILVSLLTPLLSILGFYRYVAYRPIVDVSLFILILMLMVWLTRTWGVHL